MIQFAARLTNDKPALSQMAMVHGDLSLQNKSVVI
jgi:hypothetical protein